VFVLREKQNRAGKTFKEHVGVKTHLTEIHNDALVNLLPQVSPEDLDEGDLQRRDLAVHEDSRQVELHLETHIHLKTEDRQCYAETDVLGPSFSSGTSK